MAASVRADDSVFPAQLLQDVVLFSVSAPASSDPLVVPKLVFSLWLPFPPHSPRLNLALVVDNCSESEVPSLQIATTAPLGGPVDISASLLDPTNPLTTTYTGQYARSDARFLAFYDGVPDVLVGDIAGFSTERADRLFVTNIHLRQPIAPGARVGVRLLASIDHGQTIRWLDDCVELDLAFFDTSYVADRKQAASRAARVLIRYNDFRDGGFDPFLYLPDSWEVLDSQPTFEHRKVRIDYDWLGRPADFRWNRYAWSPRRIYETDYGSLEPNAAFFAPRRILLSARARLPSQTTDAELQTTQVPEPGAARTSRPKDSFAWLHLSDLHASDGDDYEPSLVVDALVRSIPKLLADRWAPDAIFLTGDVATRGASPEYSVAEDYLGRILEAVDLNPQHLFLVPGNHDVDRASGRWLMRTLESEKQSVEYFGQTPLPHAVKLAEFREWSQRYLGFDRAPTLAGGVEPPEFIEHQDSLVAVLKLNSTFFCWDDHDKGKLWLGRRTLAPHLEEIKARSPDLSIGLIHHPLDWLHPLEVRPVKVALGRQLDILLRGHLHQPSAVTHHSQSGSLLERAAGALYQTREYENTAMLARFDFTSRCLEILHLVYVDENESWTIDTRQATTPPHTELLRLPKLEAHAARGPSRPPRV